LDGHRDRVLLLSDWKHEHVDIPNELEQPGVPKQDEDHRQPELRLQRLAGVDQTADQQSGAEQKQVRELECGPTQTLPDQRHLEAAQP